MADLEKGGASNFKGEDANTVSVRPVRTESNSIQSPESVSASPALETSPLSDFPLGNTPEQTEHAAHGNNPTVGEHGEAGAEPNHMFNEKADDRKKTDDRLDPFAGGFEGGIEYKTMVWWYVLSASVPRPVPTRRHLSLDQSRRFCIFGP